jgi:hypothetical protein
MMIKIGELMSNDNLRLNKMNYWCLLSNQFLTL